MAPRLAILLFSQFLLALATQGQTEENRSGLIVSSGYVESKRIASGDSFPIWITFENRSGQEVRDLRFVDFRTAGLQTQGPCWSPVNHGVPASPRFPACIPESAQPDAPSPLPQFLAPGEAVTVTGNLVRTARSGEFMLTGLYEWTDPKGRRRRVLVPIGPIEVTKDWDDWKTRVREDFPLVLKDIVFPGLKDLGWPLAAFFLGLFLRLGEERRAAFQQTWNQMLPHIHDYTAKYYLPISAAASEMVEATSKAIAALQKGDSEPDMDKPVYYLALLFRRMRTGMESIGGFHLKDRDGENLVVAAWNIFFEEFGSAIQVPDAIDILVHSISDQEPLQNYRRKLSRLPDINHPFPGRTELVKVKDSFGRWIQTREFQVLVLPLLEVFSTGIDYEINRPYDTWYTQPYGFDTRKILSLEGALRKTLKGTAPAEGKTLEGVREICQSLRRYRRHNTGRSWPKGTKWIVRRWYDLRAAWGALA